MSAPAGVCVSCGVALQWTMHDGLLYVRCRYCPDLFGTDLASSESRERREAVMAEDYPEGELPF